MDEDIIYSPPPPPPAGLSEDILYGEKGNNLGTTADLTARQRPAVVPVNQDIAAQLAASGTDPFNVGSGIKPFESYPAVTEIPLNEIPSAKNAIAVKGGLPFTSSPQGVRDILNANIPNVDYSEDKFGNPLAIVNGKKYHIDSPGLNALGFQRFAAQGGLGLGTAVGAAALAPEAAVGLPLFMGAQALTAGATSLGENYLAGAAGSKEGADIPKAVTEAAIAGSVPVVGKFASTLTKLGEPEVFSNLSRGSKSWLLDLSKQFRNGQIPVSPEGTADLLLDTDAGFGAAKKIVGEPAAPSPATDAILSTSAQRQAEAPARIAADIDSTVGPLTVNDKEMAENLIQSRQVVNSQLQPLLENSRPVPADRVQDIVDQIDKIAPTAKGKVSSALNHVRNMMYDTAGNLDTSPVGLQNAINEINAMIRNGGTYGSSSIRPQELPGLSAQVGNLRNDISNILRDNVNGYTKIMGQYPKIYDMGDALDLGTNILNKGTYKDLDPTVIKTYLSDPDTAKALTLGSRQAIQDKIGTAPNEVAALKATGSENSYIHQSLTNIFGDGIPERLTNIANREAGYAARDQELRNAFKAAQQQSGAQTIEKANAPIIDEEITKYPGQVFTPILRGVNAVGKKITGQTGPLFSAEQGRILTTPGDQIETLRQGVAARQAAEMNLNKALAGGMVGSSMGMMPGQRGSTYARGGRVSHIDQKVDKLIRESTRIKNLLADETERMLSLPDDTIAHALSLAKKVI
jgi:hypothetical protein